MGDYGCDDDAGYVEHLHVRCDWCVEETAVNIDHKEAARRAMCHPDTLRKMMAEGEAPGTKVGRRWIVSEEVFQQWIDKRCLSIGAPIRLSGGSSLAARLAAQLARPTA